MQVVTIHESGSGADRLQVVSYGNGLAYAVNFGAAGFPMSNLYFQGDDATEIRNEVENMENANPERLIREIWIAAIEPYLS